jgi:hypothetical protein
MGYQMRFRTPVWVVFACFLLLPFPSQGQEPIEEKPISAKPLAPSREKEYRPCSWTAQEKTAMCLKDRLELIYELQPAEFSGKGPRCELTFEEEKDPVKFRCGRLVIALRPGTPSWHYRQIAEAAEGEWEEIESYPDKRLGILRVTPGTERNALFRIIFHRGILWADFHRFVPVITETL